MRQIKYMPKLPIITKFEEARYTCDSSARKQSGYQTWEAQYCTRTTKAASKFMSKSHREKKKAERVSSKASYQNASGCTTAQNETWIRGTQKMKPTQGEPDLKTYVQVCRYGVASDPSANSPLCPEHPLGSLACAAIKKGEDHGRQQ